MRFWQKINYKKTVLAYTAMLYNHRSYVSIHRRSSLSCRLSRLSVIGYTLVEFETWFTKSESLVHTGLLLSHVYCGRYQSDLPFNFSGLIHIFFLFFIVRECIYACSKSSQLEVNCIIVDLNRAKLLAGKFLYTLYNEDIFKWSRKLSY